MIYEGGYLNDKRYGNRKKFDIDGNIALEREYLIWKNGKRKENNIDGNIGFDIEFLNGIR